MQCFSILYMSFVESKTKKNVEIKDSVLVLIQQYFPIIYIKNTEIKNIVIYESKTYYNKDFLKFRIAY